MMWQTYRLGDVVENVQSGFACGDKNVEDGFKHLRMNNIHVDGSLDLSLVRTVPQVLATSKYRLEQNDVLICTTNSGKLVGKSALFKMAGDFAFSNHLTRVRVRKEIAEPAFLQKQLWFKWFHGEIEPLCKHWVNQSTLPKEKLLSLELSLPDVEEQRCIATKLDHITACLDDSKARLDTIPAILKRFRLSVLAAACSGRLTEDWRKMGVQRDANALLMRIKESRLVAAPRETERRKIEEFYASFPALLGSEANLPNSWMACYVGSIGQVCNGSTPSRKEQSYWGGNIPWVSSGEVQNCIIKMTRERITQAGYDNCSVRLLPKGSVLIAMIGEGKTRGQSAILQLEACINQNIAAIVIDHGMIEPKYLWYWFQGQYGSTREAGSGSGPQALNCQRVRELPFNLPPLEEQIEIVRRVDDLFKQADAIEVRYRKAKTFTDKLMPAVLAKAFRGELV